MALYGLGLSCGRCEPRRPGLALYGIGLSSGLCIHGPQYGIPGRQFSILQRCYQHGPHFGILKRQFSTLQLYDPLGSASVMPRCVDMASWTGLGLGCSVISRGFWVAGASDVWASYGIQGIIQCLSVVCLALTRDEDVQIHCGPDAGLQGAGVPPDASPCTDGGMIQYISSDLESPVDRA